MLKKKPVVAEEVVSWAFAYRTQMRDRGAGSAPLRADSYAGYRLPGAPMKYDCRLKQRAFT